MAAAAIVKTLRFMVPGRVVTLESKTPAQLGARFKRQWEGDTAGVWYATAASSIQSQQIRSMQRPGDALWRTTSDAIISGGATPTYQR
jgi:hypothetical protein